MWEEEKRPVLASESEVEPELISEDPGLYMSAEELEEDDLLDDEEEYQKEIAMQRREDERNGHFLDAEPSPLGLPAKAAKTGGKLQFIPLPGANSAMGSRGTAATVIAADLEGVETVAMVEGLGMEKEGLLLVGKGEDNDLSRSSRQVTATPALEGTKILNTHMGRITSRHAPSFRDKDGRIK